MANTLLRKRRWSVGLISSPRFWVQFCGFCLLCIITLSYVLQQQKPGTALSTPSSHFLRPQFAQYSHEEDHDVSSPLAQHLEHREEGEEEEDQNLTNKDTAPFYRMGSAQWKKEGGESIIAAFSRSVLGYDTMPDQCRKGPPGFSQPRTVSKYDLTKEGPFPFLSEYRNPCWRRAGDHDLRCLPYFYLAGFPKCGTTDMFERLTRHPHVASSLKEPHWITRERFKGQTLDSYTRRLAAAISKYHNNTLAIVGDGSASTAWDNDQWAIFPGNELCMEPRVITADYVRHLNHDVKIILMLRNPTSRLYSDYLYFHTLENTGREQFHTLVQESIEAFNTCVKRHSLRACAYNSSLYPVRLHLGLYSVFLEDWLLRFPRDQLFFVRLEDVDTGETVLPQVFKFLGLSMPDRKTMQKVMTLTQRNVGGKSKLLGPMWSQTWTLLRNFYRPFNARLAQILQDHRFAWQDSELPV